MPFSKKEQKTKQKMENKIEYHFLHESCFQHVPNKKSKPFFNTEIPKSSIISLTECLRKQMGEVERKKEYTIYRNLNMDLTVLPDGSSFCHQTFSKPLEDKRLTNTKFSSSNPIDILVVYKEKTKISNDLFPSQFTYEEIIDVIDIIYPWAKGLSIILSLRYHKDKGNENSSSVKKMGRCSKIEHSPYVWCELFLQVDCEVEVEKVHECVNYVLKQIKIN